MAHLFKPCITRWVNAEGRQVPAGTPGSHKTRERARKWYVKGPPFPKPVPLCTDRQSAQVMMADLIRKVERGEAGIEDSVTRARKQPLADHLAAWEQSMRDQGNADKTVRLALARVRSVTTALGWRTLIDLSRDRAEREMARRRALPRGAPGHVGAQTSNFHLAALSQFGRWCADRRPPLLASNPFHGWHRANVKLDRRHDRREMGEDEVSRVLAQALASPRVFKGLTGRDRHALYLTAAGSGLRAGALASLTPGAFLLDDAPPVVVLAAGSAKNRRVRRQPLPLALVAFLREHLRGREPSAPVWPGLWYTEAAEMLRMDLEAAGVPYVVAAPDGTPLFADFHSLRHGYISALTRQTDLRTAQELADHSTPVLTARYAHRTPADLAGGVSGLSLPGLTSTPGHPLPGPTDTSGHPPPPPQEAPTPEQLAAALTLAWTVLDWLLVASPVTLDDGRVGQGTGRKE